MQFNAGAISFNANGVLGLLFNKTIGATMELKLFCSISLMKANDVNSSISLNKIANGLVGLFFR